MSTTERKIEPPSPALTLLRQAARQIARLKQSQEDVRQRGGSAFGELHDIRQKKKDPTLSAEELTTLQARESALVQLMHNCDEEDVRLRRELDRAEDELKSLRQELEMRRSRKETFEQEVIDWRVRAQDAEASAHLAEKERQKAESNLRGTIERIAQIGEPEKNQPYTVGPETGHPYK
jgi:chromosome segregation ATPase